MNHPHIAHHAINHRQQRIARPDPVPRDRLPYLTVRETPSLVRRQALPSTTCGSDSNSPCPKSTNTQLTTTLPVVLGAVIPIACAVILLIFLHRRHVKKLRNEDANDKHKSLDFGMDFVEPGGGRGGKGPEMSIAGEKNVHKRGGMSLDIGNSPYLLPPGLHNSRESLRSLSRSISIDDDKYRPATSLAGDNASLRSYPSHPKWGQDDASSIAGSARRAPIDDMQRGLLRNAQRMSRSSPPLDVHSPVDSIVHEGTKVEGDQGHQETEPSRSVGLGNSSQAARPVPLGENNDYLGSFVPSREPSMDRREGASDHTASHARDGELHGQALTARDPGLKDFNFETNDQHSSFSHQSIPTIHDAPVVSDSTVSPAPRISFPLSDAASDYGDDQKSEPALPAVNVSGADEVLVQSDGLSGSANRLTQHFSSFDDGYDPHRLTVAIRPLPPEDPADNAEQRANRIRSFYKEYFDDSKGGQEEYYEDFGPEFYADGVVYDPATGEYLMGPPKPFAQPVGRRAMTPPPRFQGPARHMATNSAGGFMPPGPRAFSSASGRLPGVRGPRKPPPPPAPLHVLPSPHLLKDDSSIITPIDFAPGKTYKDQREGRPETPRGGLRPYTPVVPSHVPLASSFDDLAAIPSPHALRKSGMYLPLDFAPPARFKNGDAMSDAGSIRSNRTGISATHLRNIRTGAYRVSRLPADTVGTRDDIVTSLHPTWDLR